jgi:hypothetical protein
MSVSFEYSSSAFGYDHLYFLTKLVVSHRSSASCAPKLGLEGRRLLPKVLSTCHDVAGLQNVLKRFDRSAHISCWVEAQFSQVLVESAVSCTESVYSDLPFLSSWCMLSLFGWYQSVLSIILQIIETSSFTSLVTFPSY